MPARWRLNLTIWTKTSTASPLSPYQGSPVVPFVYVTLFFFLLNPDPDECHSNLQALPKIDSTDCVRFRESLNARTVPELVATAKLWEQSLLKRYRIPFFLVRVADVRAALNSTATAWILYKEVRLARHVFFIFLGRC